MTTTATSIEMPLQSSYGAVELKVLIRKNTYRAFIITIAALVLLLLLYWLTGVLTAEKVKEAYNVPISTIQLGPAPGDADSDEDAPPPPPSSQITEIATAAKAGIPVPLPDAEIPEDLKTFANVDEIDKSLANEKGTIVDFADIPKDLDLDKNVNIQQKEEVPDIDDFIPVEKEPNVDLGELQKKVVYPDVARRANIEGKVIVRVLVGKDGKPKKAVVQQSDSEMLDKAAVEAVMKTVFTPGIQNGQPVICWVSIPIVFKLRN